MLCGHPIIGQKTVRIKTVIGQRPVEGLAHKVCADEIMKHQKRARRKKRRYY